MAVAAELGRAQETRRESLLARGSIEDLTRQGRVVTVWEAQSGQEGTPNFRESSLIFVPPQEVSFGDKAWLAPGGACEFFYAGKSMGYAELIEVTRSDSRRILKRRDRALESIGRKDAFAYTLISDEERTSLPHS